MATRRAREVVAALVVLVVLVALTVTGIVAASLAQQTSKPTIAALFSNDSSGMAFWIECRNTSGRPVESRAGNWIESYRVDGVEPPKGGRGGSGGSHPIPADDLWRGVFTLANAMTPPNAKANSLGSDGGVVRRFRRRPATIRSPSSVWACGPTTFPSSGIPSAQTGWHDPLHTFAAQLVMRGASTFVARLFEQRDRVVGRCAWSEKGNMPFDAIGRVPRLANLLGELVGRDGIEPSTLWLKARCSTTELAAQRRTSYQVSSSIAARESGTSRGSWDLRT